MTSHHHKGDIGILDRHGHNALILRHFCPFVLSTWEVPTLINTEKEISCNDCGGGLFPGSPIW